jgi:hypothetical protein
MTTLFEFCAVLLKSNLNMSVRMNKTFQILCKLKVVSRVKEVYHSYLLRAITLYYVLRGIICKRTHFEALYNCY